MTPVNNKILLTAIAFILFNVSTQLAAQEITLRDRITGFNVAADSSFSNQLAGNGRHILFTQITISSPTTITRAMSVSDSTELGASMYEYAVRSNTSPYTLIDSGPATRTSRTPYPNVTHNGNNSNLDEFSFTSTQLPPGTYYVGVYSSDGVNYSSIAHSSGDIGPLFADNGSAILFAPTDYHLFVSYFGIAVNSSSGSHAVPMFPPLVSLAGLLSLLLVAFKTRLK
ncbi:hypothetical protein [Pseudoteredinibacter isoporae]|uniref:PEP-CTERM sorting domain-containing protein n=1 Tax=Pseudoteredinibacter isoporae TaxID=570281 RepID=A0A7X0MWK1_9GAMM|nr:hypothetical protein [Pseudoteredinibacter isoporae]MBB6522270.1 hypothetical protein [Pseudoteredinibacter isoporae]NHO87803.1 hypothetical protein [Pseudoteredinibacter isoporae]NIB23866.1 hypothetical protein [Pseudoteredinibacter isoporae]